MKSVLLFAMLAALALVLCPAAEKNYPPDAFDTFMETGPEISIESQVSIEVEFVIVERTEDLISCLSRDTNPTANHCEAMRYESACTAMTDNEASEVERGGRDWISHGVILNM